MTNKELVLHGFREFAAGNLEPLRTLLHEDFVEHVPGNPSGRDAFLDFIAAAPVATATLDLKRVVADDDYVVVHYHMTVPGTPARAVVDIWRFENHRIVEHWDVVQPEVR
ncbi:nuclear transport factor 2 family protein [Actinoplanes sp. KI2]|uniref:nuclear transport factor 2 family protein n=1 Tax=Actinoplanes sp. KI2 TaxID=2983315 RepID=UPI0021D59F81|nr:nuclear transport factor 2 family protein [Actinoplanes sp. KI2]MCU7727265.1 nuclear transport factor 2 family protein [Actinoplanes sp. KI2]